MSYPHLPARQQPPPGSRIVVDTTYWSFNFVYSGSPPVITINGYGHRGRWGQNPIDVPPGDHRVSVNVHMLYDLGHAHIPVRCAPGQQVTVYYAAPASSFTGGAIGFQPQQPPGKKVMLGLMIGAPAAGLLVVLLIVLAGVIAAAVGG